MTALSNIFQDADNCVSKGQKISLKKQKKTNHQIKNNQKLLFHELLYITIE